MAELNSIFRLTRVAVFATTSIFALIVLILSGIVTNFANNAFDGFFNFAALGIATALLTLLSLPVMLGLSMIRKGVFTSMIVLEISWTWFLWIMWLAVGGDSASGLSLVGNCNRFIEVDRVACQESSAIAAFGFLSWIILLVYFAFLSTLTIRQQMRGNGVWTQDVTETDFTAVGTNNTQIAYDNKVSPNQYPMAGTQTQAGVPYQAASPYPQPQAGSPYPQPQAPALYAQPQVNTGSYTQPQPQTGTSPYPQV